MISQKILIIFLYAKTHLENNSSILRTHYAEITVSNVHRINNTLLDMNNIMVSDIPTRQFLFFIILTRFSRLYMQDYEDKVSTHDNFALCIYSYINAITITTGVVLTDKTNTLTSLQIQLNNTHFSEI